MPARTGAARTGPRPAPAGPADRGTPAPADAVPADAVAITRAASRQSYLTIRWLVDRAYRADAFAYYAYFRWLDDEVDEHLGTRDERLALVARQRALLARVVAGEAPGDVGPQEALLVHLAGQGAPRLHLALTAMLDAMERDAARRGRLVPQAELDACTHDLAVAVTEALHHCIGHGCRSPEDDSRYVAVTGAHVAHMLRDAVADVAAGYLNVPAELVPGGTLGVADLHGPELRAWVRDRVALARSCFAQGRAYLARVENRRCRLAGHAYIARFEWVLDAIERDGYRLRAAYPERGTLRGGLQIAAAAARSALAGRAAPSAGTGTTQEGTG